MKKTNDITVRVTKKDILTSSYTSNDSCPLAKALLRKGFDKVFVTPIYVRIGRKYYDLSPDDNDKLINQDTNKEFKFPVSGMVITLTPS